MLPLTAKELLRDSVEILYRNFWPLISIFVATDAAMYALHRVSHRITNEGVTSSPASPHTHVHAVSAPSGGHCALEMHAESAENS